MHSHLVSGHCVLLHNAGRADNSHHVWGRKRNSLEHKTNDKRDIQWHSAHTDERDERNLTTFYATCVCKCICYVCLGRVCVCAWNLMFRQKVIRTYKHLIKNLCICGHCWLVFYYVRIISFRVRLRQSMTIFIRRNYFVRSHSVGRCRASANATTQTWCLRNSVAPIMMMSVCVYNVYIHIEVALNLCLCGKNRNVFR